MQPACSTRRRRANAVGKWDVLSIRVFDLFEYRVGYISPGISPGAAAPLLNR